MFHSKINGVSSNNNLPRTKDGVYVINPDALKSIRTHWIALYVHGNNIIYYDNFEVEYFSKEIKSILGNKNIITNIFRT